MSETIPESHEKKSDEGESLIEAEIPPGVYRVDELGEFHPAMDWQPILQRIKWEELNKLIEYSMRRGGSERIVNLAGMYILTGLTLLILNFACFT